MTPNYRLRVIPSFLWMDQPLGYTVEEVEPGLYRYAYFSCERSTDERRPRCVDNALMMDSMRIAVVGSRRFEPESAVREYVRSLPPSVVVISGGATGVDSWAVDEARKRGLKVEVYKADWQKDGKSAGIKRNAVLVSKSDAVVCFWDGRSRGSASTIRMAEAEKMPLAIIRPNDEGPGLMLITSEEPENLYLARREGH